MVRFIQRMIDTTFRFFLKTFDVYAAVVELEFTSALRADALTGLRVQISPAVLRR